MKISYRLLRLSTCVGLLGLGRLALAQTAAPDDSLKGRIWTATARRIWFDEKVGTPPKAWATGADFSKWALTQKPDKTELGSLFSAVLTRVGQGQPATPAQVTQAIIAEVGERKAHKTGALAKVNLEALQTDLAAFGPAAGTPPAGVATTNPATPAAATTSPAGAGSTVVTAVPGASGLTALPADTARPPAPTQQPAATTFTSTPAAPRYLGLPPSMAGLALLLLGGLLGVGLANAMRPSRRHGHRHHDHSAPAELDSSAIMDSQEYRKLTKQNQTLKAQLHRLQQQLDELSAQLTGKAVALPKAVVTAKTPPPVAVAAVPAPVAPSIEELVGAPAEQVASAPAATRYGPVQETPFLEERKIVDSPLPQLALMLTVNPRDPSQATFTLNPQVDQARLIGDGLTRLQKFFEYDPPLGGRITSVAAVRPGKLQRQDSGWQVVERARLAIS